MASTPLYLITGFLGSGKTTFVQRAIEYFDGKQKIAVVQNEFAPANFDGQELKRSTHANFNLLEVNNGSVFCVCLLSGFIDSLHDFVSKYQPEIILMEASGLSDPVSIGQIFNSPKLQENIYLAGTICIADALNFNKFDKLLPRIHHQLQIADIILINKTDLIINIEEISLKINQFNPLAKKYNSQYCNVPMDEIFHIDVRIMKKLFFISGDSSRPDVQSIVFKSTRPIKQELVDNFILQLTAKTMRVKGYILLDNNKSLSIQTVSDEIHVKEIPADIKQTELIIMGYNITTPSIKSLYANCQ